MNTVDLRDMESDQTLFWTVAMPTTFVVLAIAFLYGYKWDWLVARVARVVEQRRNWTAENKATRPPAQTEKDQPAASPLSPTLVDELRSRSGDEQSGVTRSQWSWREDAINGLKGRRRKTGEGIIRRSTDRSLGR